MSAFSRQERELLSREAALRAAGRASNPVDRANAELLRRTRLRAELKPARGPLPLFDTLPNGESKAMSETRCCKHCDEPTARLRDGACLPCTDSESGAGRNGEQPRADASSWYERGFQEGRGRQRRDLRQ